MINREASAYRIPRWSLVIGLAEGSADLRLIDAVRNGDQNAVRQLLQNHADVNATRPDGSTALIWAAEAGRALIATRGAARTKGTRNLDKRMKSSGAFGLGWAGWPEVLSAVCSD